MAAVGHKGDNAQHIAQILFFLESNALHVFLVFEGR